MADNDNFQQHLQSVDTMLRSAFARMGPTDTVLTSITRVQPFGWGLSFSVVWPSVDSDASNQMSSEIRAFSGKLHWTAAPDFNNRGVVVSALPKNLLLKNARDSRFITQSDMEKDTSDFAEYIETRIAIRGIKVSGAEERLGSAEYGPSAFDVYLVSDPEVFHYDVDTFELMPTSADDKRLYIVLPEPDLSSLGSELGGTRSSKSDQAYELLSNLLDQHSRIQIELEDMSDLNESLGSLVLDLREEASRRIVFRIRDILTRAKTDGLSVVLEPTR